MKFFGLFGAILTATAMLTTASVVVADDIISDQAVLELAPGVDIDDIHADYGTVTLDVVESQNLYLVGLPELWDEDEFEMHFDEGHDDRVLEAELNHAADVAEGQTESFYLLVESHEYDTQYTWGRINLGLAHTQSRGAGVMVAVLDTGADMTHPGLVGHVVAGGDYVDGDDDVSDVGDGVDSDGDGDIDEMVGHGTFIAGVVAAIVPDAEILIVRVLDGDGAGSSFRVAHGIYDAVDAGADVINLSLAMLEEHEVLELALEYAQEHDVVVVSAAGNLDREDPAAFPSDDDDVLGIAATDADDRKTASSSFGTHVALSAPGADVVSMVPGGDYAQWEGTSVATALVAAGAALVRAHDAKASAEDIKDILRATAADLDVVNPEHAGRLGAGRLDVAAALGAEPVIGDINQDGSVDFGDLLVLLERWGTDDPLADLTGDGVVDAADLIVLLGSWG